MENVYIKVEDMNKWVAKYFPNKDLVTIEDLLSVIEDLDSELSNKEEEYKELENNLHDNYKPISAYDMYGISEKEFH